MNLPVSRPILRRAANVTEYTETKKLLTHYKNTGTFPVFCLHQPFPYKGGTALMIKSVFRENNRHDCVMIHHTKDGYWRDIYCKASYTKNSPYWKNIHILANDPL